MSRFSFTLFTSLFLFSLNLQASPETDFELGTQAFKSGENETAVRYFESAMKQGMNSVSLQYNLASSYYKVGRYEDAKKLFKLTYKTDAMRDLADYNLGLIALKQKQWQLAREYFTSVVNSGRDKKLTKISQQQLKLLSKGEKRSKVTAFANFGYDDNVVSVSSESALNESDSFYDVYAAADYLVAGKRDNGWIANASVYMLDYSDLDSANLDLLGLGLKKTFKLDDWKTSLQFK
ncbi:MAG: tetratricopeptide repeat protein, partial [Gammaproteobacteria bacterium]|nr:tetratricopeptide repeat protein [Gammaproteobacteria bacterium]